MLLLMRDKSAKNIIHEIGPKIDPFGTPKKIFCLFLFSFFKKSISIYQ